MNDYETLKQKEEVTWRRYYEYVCLFCKTKRKTRKHKLAIRRVCNACMGKRVKEEFNKRQLPLFS